MQSQLKDECFTLPDGRRVYTVCELQGAVAPGTCRGCFFDRIGTEKCDYPGDYEARNCSARFRKDSRGMIWVLENEYVKRRMLGTA